ncbi:hypothetical protein N172_03975 [Pantoea dispersa EGD-AAK13]|nr:hypothetical protein N172_03975 [Pantoea dispersa EGD-AAK13]KAF0857249.1 hypothetical protein Y788_02425 [Pantoea dispersa 625]
MSLVRIAADCSKKGAIKAPFSRNSHKSDRQMRFFAYCMRYIVDQILQT